MSNSLDFKNVVVTRDGKDVLKSVSWQVEGNERWVVLGPNGAGKTTLLKVAAAQIQPSSGTAEILGQALGATNVFDLRTRVGFASSSLAARIPNSESVLNAVLTASYAVTGRWKEHYEEIDERRAKRVLAEWDLAELADRAFGTLSDGEQKRVQLARAVMTDPEILLLDEPVASLDLGSREQTVALLGAYASTPDAPAIIMVTHHLEEIPAGFTHALLMSKGEVVGQGTIEEVFSGDLLSKTYGLPLTVTRDSNRYSVRTY
jgi:iron complex transport system ATP-binding protein